MTKKKYVIVGAGGRALYMFAKPMATELQDYVDFRGVFDRNQTRARLLSEECGLVPVYADFHQMLDEVEPDVVVVASTDDTHHHYIIESLEAGCDVISEKPMTIDEEKTRAILEAERKSGKEVTVTFNLRFAPYFAKVKELILTGAIGDVYHIQLEWFLDRDHGADYFRRWHSEMKNSGGLLVHKSTHHFDIINWWVDSRPKQLQAFGARHVYGDQGQPKGERCMTCEYAATCEFYKDITKDPFMKKYYAEAEYEDGYWRDRCVFDERVDIYDTMSVNLQYENGVFLNYSLVAYSPYEGWKATINGSKGRLEVGNVYRSADMSAVDASTITYHKLDGSSDLIEVSSQIGGHGGGDEKLRKAIFAGGIEDPLGQQADSLAGAESCLIGATANRSIVEGKLLQVPDLQSLRR
ncbi:Gfo/Idh/MocA family oxidoreductase [Paenibacillus sp. J5C_2022]|uniref:Gfo/Idh/MocA family protein n=1 Tax=Paenibacillus sp. J5C2022 TaxID=2977129 RepID=UPI0021CF0AF6|nr:Gfo/Idh/MocA family oxidoreductase [Paenibacillus sp. J5C2022]MCU6711562.1 Gfo/Idh/MocA family oxidoreductase [Paenibacillus sp. J5C2022]